MPPVNLLLQRLPLAQRRALLGLCEPFARAGGAPLPASAGLLFPLSGCFALLAPAAAHAPLGIALIGAEGCLGAERLLDLGLTLPSFETQTRGSVQGLALPAALLPHALALCPALAGLLQRQLSLLLSLTATAVGCQRFHDLAPRLARWLLMRQARCEDGGQRPFASTHEQLAADLGVRRVGVTVAAGALQRAGVIDYHRGLLQVRDPARLLALSCPCQAQDRAHRLAAFPVDARARHV
jgi:CRP-like cAMP-binding protein